MTSGEDNNEPLKWEVYYGDGSVIRDCDCEPYRLPKRNVQAVVMECRSHGRVVCKADDFYIYAAYDGELSWQGVDYFGMWDYLADPGVKIVLFGRTLGNVEYSQVIQRAMNSEYLPPKTASFPGERKAAVR